MGSARDQERERRISMEIIVDANSSEEQALGWYYSLEDRLGFPFVAMCGPACHLAVTGRRRGGGGRC
jgi:Calcium binding